MPIVPGSCRASIPPSSPCLAMECPSETANHTSMAAKLQELLSWAVLDNSSPASGNTTPRRPTSVALGAPLTIGAEDPLRLERPVLAMPKWVATSQQVSLWEATPHDTIPISHFPSLALVSETPEAASVPTAPQSETHPGTDLGTLSDKVLWLQREMNRAMEWLLTTRASIDALHRKQVSDTKTTFHQKRPKLPKPLRRWGSIVQPQSEMLRLHVQQLSGRQRPSVGIMPTPYNNHMGKVCRT